MILGVGIDIIEIERVEKAAEREGFVARILAPKELEDWERRGRPMQTLAGAFAAKEAVAKAFGTGIGEIAWQEIEVLHDEKGNPYVCLTGNAREFMRRNGAERVHISISHSRAYAVAQAVLEDLD